MLSESSRKFKMAPSPWITYNVGLIVKYFLIQNRALSKPYINRYGKARNKRFKSATVSVMLLLFLRPRCRMLHLRKAHLGWLRDFPLQHTLYQISLVISDREWILEFNPHNTTNVLQNPFLDLFVCHRLKSVAGLLQRVNCAESVPPPLTAHGKKTETHEPTVFGTSRIQSMVPSLSYLFHLSVSVNYALASL